MSIMQIMQLNDSNREVPNISLRQESKPIVSNELASPWLIDLLRNMFKTLYSSPMGVGLAAPQVGVMLRLVVIDIKRDAKNPIVLINPSYEPIGNALVESKESCLSIPGVSGNVQRYETIKIRHTALSGEVVEKTVTGFKARVIQHEIDHLDGVLFIDKVIEGTIELNSEGTPGKLADASLSTVIDYFE